MEVGELLKQMIYLVIPVVAVIVFISIAWNSSGQDCKLAVSGNDFIILANLKACIERCWSKHDSGADLYVDDCFVVNVATKEQLDKNRIESSVSKAVPVRVYFDLLEENESYVIKVRYNSTGKEISLILFETSSQSTTTTEIPPFPIDIKLFYSTLKEKEYDNVEILLVQRLKDFGLSYVKSHPIKDFDQTNLDRTNTLILLHPVEKELAQAQIQKIKTWVQKGGNLMGIGLNLTDTIMMDIFGVSGQPQSSFINPVENQSSYLKIKQRTKIFNGISGIDYNPSYGLVLNYTSISGKILAEIYDSSKSKVIGTGIIENDYGSGEAYYFGYTIGYTILRMIEGKGLEPPTLRGTEYQAVLSESEWDYPVADFHIYPIINIILEKNPLFVYWIPNGKTSLIAITGDSDGAPDATIDSWFKEIKDKGLVGTVFLLGDRGHSISNYKHHDGMEFGTHNWKGSETYCTAKQRVIGGGFPTPLSNRNHGLYWSNLVDDPKEMEECGIQFDSNMETGLIDPPYTTGVYSFGTTLPYYFFDIDGSMINLLEIPQYYQDWFYIMQSGGGASNINAQQMEGSFDKIYSDIKNFKGVGTLNLHQIYVGFGNYLTFFRYALDKLSKDDVVVWTMGDIGNWWKSRDEISLTQETQNSFVINSQISIDDIPFLTTSTKIKFDGTEENCEKHMTIFEREWCAYILKVSAGSHTLQLK